jgi:glycosyltransferase involved in cell wall biosynthesis
MKKRVAFLTTVFLMEEVYLREFFQSLRMQTEKDFDLVVVNDGYPDLKRLIREFGTLRIIPLPHRGTPAKNREFGINYCVDQGYDVIIFGDSDDFFDKNRIRCSLRGLRYRDIVVNDLTPVDKQNRVLFVNYLSGRIDHGCRIDKSFIDEKNIFGLSNTAVNTKKIRRVVLPEHLSAVDWYFFSRLLYMGLSAQFIPRGLTYYRQHGANTVGIGSSADQKKLQQIVNVKKNHYKQMRLIDKKFDALFEKYTLLEAKAKNGMKIEGKHGINPLWWEEI